MKIHRAIISKEKEKEERRKETNYFSLLNEVLSSFPQRRNESRRKRFESFGENDDLEMCSLPLFCVDPDFVLKDDNCSIEWRRIKPDYSQVNLLFENSKQTNHSKDSVEYLVQCLVKNWEKEASHKIRCEQMLTMAKDQYRFSCNGQRKYNLEEMIEQGTYNALIGQTNYYDSNQISFEESHLIFKKCLSDGFAWEVLQVYSSSPNVTFTWRHFGPMINSFHCRALSGQSYQSDPTKQMIELFGMCKATINHLFQIEDLQVFYDPNQLFQQLTQINPFAPFQTFSSHLKTSSSHSNSRSTLQIEHRSIHSKDSSRKHLEEKQREISTKNASSKICVLF